VQRLRPEKQPIRFRGEYRRGLVKAIPTTGEVVVHGLTRCPRAEMGRERERAAARQPRPATAPPKMRQQRAGYNEMPPQDCSILNTPQQRWTLQKIGEVSSSLVNRRALTASMTRIIAQYGISERGTMALNDRSIRRMSIKFRFAPSSFPFPHV
jgi:hypothetical protein